MSREIDILNNRLSSRRTVLILTWPIIVEQLLSMMVNYVDTAMVGSIGVDATASIAVVTSTIWLIGGLMMGVSVGFSVLVSRAVGYRDFAEAKEIVRQSFLTMVGFGLIITLLVEFLIAPFLPGWMGANASIRQDSVNYFRITGAVYVFDMFLFVGGGIIRGAGDSRSPMIYSILNNAVNIVGNFFFIYQPRTIVLFGIPFRVWGAGLGVSGAALGTAAGAAVCGIMIIHRIFDPDLSVSISLHDRFRPDRKIQKQALTLGIPTALERITISGGQLVVTMLATGLGTSALAAHQLANTAEQICYMPAYSFGVSATTLVAQSLGANRPELAKTYSRDCILDGVILISACAVLLYIFAPELMGLFIRDAGVIAAGAQVLRIQALAEPAVGITNVVSGILRGGGDTVGPFVIGVAGMWVVRITLAVIMIHMFQAGLVGIWIPMAADWVVRACCCLLRMRSGKWMHKLD